MLRSAGAIAVYSAVLLVLSSTLVPCGATQPVEANWPQFRGADATGVSRNTGLPDHWSVTPGATGDLTLPEGETSNEFIVWSSTSIAPYNPGTIVNDGRLFVLYDRGLVSCFNAKTGDPFFQFERLHRGSEFTASPWSCDGKWFCLNEDGVCSVIKAGDSLEVLHTNSLAEDDLTLSTPAIAGDRLLIRTDKRVYCIRNPVK